MNKKYLEIVDPTEDPIPTRIEVDLNNTLTIQKLRFAFPDACCLKYKAENDGSYIMITPSPEGIFLVPDRALNGRAICIRPRRMDYISRSEFLQAQDEKKDARLSLNLVCLREPATEVKNNRKSGGTLVEENQHGTRRKRFGGISAFDAFLDGIISTGNKIARTRKDKRERLDVQAIKRRLIQVSNDLEALYPEHDAAKRKYGDLIPTPGTFRKFEEQFLYKIGG